MDCATRGLENSELPALSGTLLIISVLIKNAVIILLAFCEHPIGGRRFVILKCTFYTCGNKGV